MATRIPNPNRYRCKKCGKPVAFHFVDRDGDPIYDRCVEWNRDLTAYRPHVCKPFKCAWEDEK